jgi:hypothetical protein
MKGGTIKLRKKKGRGKISLRPRPMTVDVQIKHDDSSTKKTGIGNSSRGVAKTTSKKKKTLEGVRKEIEKRIKIDIEQPKFESLFLGQLYKFFYRDENGPYQIFKTLKNSHEGSYIPIDKLKNRDYLNMITKLRENITKLSEDLKHFEESVYKISKIKIPSSIDDDLSKLLGLSSINE